MSWQEDITTTTPDNESCWYVLCIAYKHQKETDSTYRTYFNFNNMKKWFIENQNNIERYSIRWMSGFCLVDVFSCLSNSLDALNQLQKRLGM